MRVADSRSMKDLEIVFYRRPKFYYATLESDENFETVARAPGCLQKTFIVKFGSAPLRQEGNTMFGPGEYRPDPSAGIRGSRTIGAKSHDFIVI